MTNKQRTQQGTSLVKDVARVRASYHGETPVAATEARAAYSRKGLSLRWNEALRRLRAGQPEAIEEIAGTGPGVSLPSGLWAGLRLRQADPGSAIGRSSLRRHTKT